MKWQEFESFVAEIFRVNDFKVKQNFRFKTSRRYEIDVVAIGQRFLFCVDCKQWSGGRYKKSQLKTAVAEQKRRVRELKKFLKSNSIARIMLKAGGKNFYPLIVTQLEEDLLNEKDVWVVPVWKLNNFLLDEGYLT